MKDFIGQELEIGDLIATTDHGYASLQKGVIKSFTPKKVKLDNGDTKFPYQVALIRKHNAPRNELSK